MTAWAQLLHFYQPPTQTHDVLARIVEESYRPLLAVLAEHKNARVAINMNAVLTDLLSDHGYNDVLDSLRVLGERGQVEFAGSGRYHPILPLIPEGERVRAIADNARVNRKLLGPSWQARGFFPPEMCYSADILPSIANSGHDWIMLSGVACPAEWPLDKVYRVPADGRTMHVLFRDDVRSNRISFRETNAQAFVEDLSRWGGGKEAYIVTAMDAETYGHHIGGWEREFLGATYELLGHQGRPHAHTTKVVAMKPSELIGRFPDGPVVEPFPSSWSTSRDDIAAHNPYPLWRAPGNDVHRLQWEYVDHCVALLALAQRYAKSDEAKKFAALADHQFPPALHSCQFWWASRRPMWDVPMIHRGFLLLNQVLLDAWKAVVLGDASERVKQEASWRVAAAARLRTELERLLFEEGA
jgi:alpha-amylase/alpha-mannosidase (GH57 family)